MFQNIYVPVDNSELSNSAVDLAVQIGVHNGSRLTGSHVYAAKLHDQRFRAMESGLPSEFQKEKELERQRKVHDSLITKGLELITDSYLKVMDAHCDKAGLEFQGVSLEGKNWQELAKDIEKNSYDLIVMGAHGLGRVPGSLLGSVTERVVRRTERDVIIVKRKEEENKSDRIVVCLDGSERSYGALKTAMDLAVKFHKSVEAISAFDPYYHYVMFDSLSDVLTSSAREVFKFEEQEKLHEEIIDSGLAKVYQANLDIARRIAGDEGVDVATKLLDGKAWLKILEYVEKDPPWLLVMGRTGIHNEDIDLGSNAENILRMVPCNVLLADRKFKPPVEYQADETIAWTKEATTKMALVPSMAKGIAMKAIQQHAVAEGHTMITSSVVDEAIKALLPPEAITAMGIPFEEEVKDDGEEVHGTFTLSFECPSCKYVHHDRRPEKCPVCGKEGETFNIVDASPVVEKREEEGITETTFDGRKLIWLKEAKEIIDGIDDEVASRHIRAKLEKQAHVRRQSTITKEMVLGAMGEVSPQREKELEWTEEALKRLSRVPEGFMRDAAKKKIEEYAGSEKIAVIDLEIAEKGLEKAKEKMMKAVKDGGHPSSVPIH